MVCFSLFLLLLNFNFDHFINKLITATKSLHLGARPENEAKFARGGMDGFVRGPERHNELGGYEQPARRDVAPLLDSACGGYDCPIPTHPGNSTASTQVTVATDEGSHGNCPTYQGYATRFRASNYKVEEAPC